jgi:hypothetical protein
LPKVLDGNSYLLLQPRGNRLQAYRTAISKINYQTGIDLAFLLRFFLEFQAKKLIHPLEIPESIQRGAIRSKEKIGYLSPSTQAIER